MTLDTESIMEMVRECLARVHNDHSSTAVQMCMKDGTPVAMVFFTPLCMEEAIVDVIQRANKRHRDGQPNGAG